MILIKIRLEQNDVDNNVNIHIDYEKFNINQNEEVLTQKIMQVIHSELKLKRVENNQNIVTHEKTEEANVISKLSDMIK